MVRVQKSYFRFLALASGLASSLLLVAFSPLHAEDGGSDPADWALEIAEKEYDETTGDLQLRLENSHESLAVTAFGVKVFIAPPIGSGGTQVHALEMTPGETLEPGESHEMTVHLSGSVDAESAPSAFKALSVSLLYEILSDRTSRGNAVRVEEIFQSRAIRASEYEKALERLLVARASNRADEPLSEFLRREEARSKQATAPIVSDVFHNPTTFRERERSSAIRSVASLMHQAQQRIDQGEAAEETLDALEFVMRRQLEDFAGNVRPDDLQWSLEIAWDVVFVGL